MANTIMEKHVEKLRQRVDRLVSMSESSEEWKSSTKRETYGLMEQELSKLLKTVEGDSEKLEYWKKELDAFKHIFARYLRAKSVIDWKKIQPLPEGAIIPYNNIKAADHSSISNLLNKLVVVKLNGGLGTSMGCKGPKSVISVRNDLTFLDLTLQQIQHLNKTYNVSVPLVLMNSFNTDEDTQKLLRKYGNIKVEVHSFCQSRYPRINRETYMPIGKSLNDSDLECILNFMDTDSKQPEFVMEVTDKTKADVKGGTLIEYEDRLMLLEIAQVPSDYVDEFKSVSKFRIFNTNNIWARLDAVKRVVEKQELEMEIIVNPKHLDRGIDVIQLETAAGAAVKNFKGACGIVVPRSRFLPVKKTSDLLLLMSNLYDIENGNLTLSSLRSFPTTPLVKLGNNFDKVNEFLKRFQGIPDLLELDHLTVSGDVWFGRDVTLKGTVIIIATENSRIDIPIGAMLENKIVSGNLRILDH
ncbi:UTP--glucose-1-phosphate uridylyltransferase domain-containing protein [Ditylenchus destructor]|uniref:UTP--glucose-1-phosphate uridylyltransferase n=1 Tax=Ditylenchus destructor TaxID=166010 RepID=A0AAD4NNI9_9BILA|nr:UTP--glucose-1-phosphate uridylyltransferase domain-containing protein [Ditylenchus destructor]